MKIIQATFPAKNYVREETEKTQIVIHHTVSGEGVQGDIAWWDKQTEKIATHYIIERDGTIHQLFDTKFWAYHLGVTKEHCAQFGLPYSNLNKNSIGIELDSWGPVLPSGGKFYPVKWDADLKKHVPNTAAKAINGYPQEYCGKGYRGHQFYETYTDKQLHSLGLLLEELCLQHFIPIKYKGDAFFETNALALGGQSGIWGHCSFRKDKSDPHPQPNLINLLKKL